MTATIPRQRDRVTHRPPAGPGLLRRLAERYLLGVAEAAGVVTVGAVTYAVLVRVVL